MNRAPLLLLQPLYFFVATTIQAGQPEAETLTLQNSLPAQTTNQSEVLRDIHGPLPTSEYPPYLIEAAIFLLLLLLLALFLYFLQKKKKTTTTADPRLGEGPARAGRGTAADAERPKSVVHESSRSNPATLYRDAFCHPLNPADNSRILCRPADLRSPIPCSVPRGTASLPGTGRFSQIRASDD